MLAGWTETHNGGAKVTFWLPDPDELDTFRGLTVAKGKTAGQRFMCVLVEISDDETAKPPPEKTGVAKLGPLALLAVMWCRDPLFQKWSAGGLPSDKPCTEAACRTSILEVCGINSRRELDANTLAASTFAHNFREPFMAWLKETGQTVE